MNHELQRAKADLANVEDQMQVALSRSVHADKEGHERLIGEIESLSTKAKELREQVLDLEKDALADPTAEVELGPKLGFRKYIRASAEETPLNGVEAEMDQEDRQRYDGRPGTGVWVPFAALGRGAIQNADARTNPPDADTGDMVDWVRRIFARSVMSFIGVRMDSVAPGTREHIVVTGGTTPQLRNVDQGKDSSAASMSLVTLKPTRMAAAYTLNVEDICHLGGQYEAAMRDDLQGAVNEEVDKRLLLGTGSAPQWTGLISGNQTASGTAETFDRVATRLGGNLIDGRNAYTLMDLRTVIGVASAGRFAGQFANSGKGDVSALEWLATHTGGVRVSDLVPAASSNEQKALAVRTGSGPNAVFATWHGGLQLIRDEISGADRGRVRITANLFCDFATLRSAGFVGVSQKVA